MNQEQQQFQAWYQDFYSRLNETQRMLLNDSKEIQADIKSGNIIKAEAEIPLVFMQEKILVHNAKAALDDTEMIPKIHWPA